MGAFLAFFFLDTCDVFQSNQGMNEITLVWPWVEFSEVCDISVSRTKLYFSFVTLFLSVVLGKQWHLEKNFFFLILWKS